MARSKVKSRSHHDAAHLHPLTNVPTKYQLPTPYSFRDITRTRFYRSRSLQQGQRSNQGQAMRLHAYTTLTNIHTKYQLPTPYGFLDIARTRVYRSRSLQQGQRSNDVSQLHPLIYVPTKYQLPTPYGFSDIAQTRFYRSRSLWQGQRSNQGRTMMLHTYSP